MQAVSRKSGTGRLFRYICSAYWNRGTTVCDNRRMATMEIADAAIRELLATEVLNPARIEAALDKAIAMLRTTDKMVPERNRLTQRLRDVERTSRI
jgi:hypothetical protein